MKKEIYSNHFGRKEEIATILMALAGQENCDGEPYDEMYEAAEYIDFLEGIVNHVEKSSAGKIVLMQYKEWREYLDALPRLKKTCKHLETKHEILPDNECIEICSDCGMSRSVWEQGESDWMEVDIEKLKEDTKKVMQKIKEHTSIYFK